MKWNAKPRYSCKCIWIIDEGMRRHGRERIDVLCNKKYIEDINNGTCWVKDVFGSYVLPVKFFCKPRTYWLNETHANMCFLTQFFVAYLDTFSCIF